MINLLITLIFCHMAWGNTSLAFKTPLTSVNQGEIVEGALVLTEGPLPTTSLSGKNFGKTIYVLKVEPFISQTGVLEAKAKIIFSKVPNDPLVSEKINGETITIFWKNLEIKPTEATESFLWGDFVVPSRKQFIPWILGILFVSVVSFLSLIFFRKRRLLKIQKTRRLALRDQLLGAQSYDEVVKLWKQKHQTIKEFPELESAFKELEKTLFKYQFKPTQSDREVEQVMQAYRQFRDDVKKETHGI